MKSDQDWIVVEQKCANNESSATTGRQLDRNNILGVENYRYAVPQQPDDIHELLSSINNQRKELAATTEAMLKSQGHEQEERELFQAQFYAFQIQQEEREARRLEHEEAGRELTEARFATKLAQNNEELQCLHIDLDAVNQAVRDNRDLSESFQEQVDQLTRDWKSQMASLVDATAQLEGHVGEIATQVSELFAAVAKFKLGHGGSSPSQAAGVAGRCLHSRGVALPVSCDGGSAHVRGSPSYDTKHGGVRLPLADSSTAQRHGSKRGQYDCEWYLPEP